MKHFNDMHQTIIGGLLSIFGLNLHGSGLQELLSIITALTGAGMLILVFLKWLYDMKIRYDQRGKAKAELQKAEIEVELAQIEVELAQIQLAEKKAIKKIITT